MTAGVHWSSAQFVVVDVEGNGSRPQELVELATLRIEGAVALAPPRTWLVRPLQPITWAARRVHGISDQDVADKPRIGEVRASVQKQLGDGIIVGHRVAVDRDLLQSQIPGWFPSAALDTWKLAKAVLPGMRSYGLHELVGELGLAEDICGRPHRAGYDVLVTTYLFLALAKQMDEREHLTLERLSRLCAIQSIDDGQGRLF